MIIASGTAAKISNSITPSKKIRYYGNIKLKYLIQELVFVLKIPAGQRKIILPKSLKIFKTPQFYLLSDKNFYFVLLLEELLKKFELKVF